MQKLNIPAGLHMRPAQAKDNPFLESLHKSIRQDLQLIDGEPDFIESVIEMQLRAQSSGYGDQYPNAMYFVIEKHHELIGKVTVDFGHNEVRIIEIAFIPQAQGNGFGEVIIRSLMQAAEQSQAPLTLTVARNNPQAFKFYLRLGFTVVEESPMYLLLSWYPASNPATTVFG